MSFKGDQESHLTELILASQTKKPTDDAVLKERALVPFFDSPLDSAALQPLSGKAGAKKGAAPDKGRKSSAQPMTVDSAGAKAPRRKKGAKPAEGGAAPDHPNRKHHRDPSYRSLPGLAPTASTGGGAAVSGRQSPPRKRQESQFYDTASSAPSRFAGPAFTLSPMPDTLPIPTTSLLLDSLML